MNQTKPLEVSERRNNNPNLLNPGKNFIPVKWETAGTTSGNIRMQLKTHESFYEEVSAPYLLSRLCAQFHGLYINTGGQEFYKITWETALKHRKTGFILTFYDWKGGAAFGSDISGNDIPQEFLDDVRNLLDALVDDHFPHPYDGCVIGELA